MNSRFLLLLIAAILASWAAVFSRTFAYDWFYDDYHLIRPYSGEELLSTLAGHWDIDVLETAGYRPVFTLLHHIRGKLFGESVFAQRLFQVFLMGAFLHALGLLLFKLGSDRATVARLFVVLAASRVFTTHLLFLADDRQILSGILIAYAALAAFSFIDTRKPVYRVLAVVPAVLALLAHEDSYVIAPLLAALVFFYRSKKALLGPAKGIILCIALSTCVHLALRTMLVPEAPKPTSLNDMLRSYYSQIRMAVFNFGDYPFPSFDVPDFREGNLFQTSSPLAKYIMSAHALILGGVAGAAVCADRSSFLPMLVCGLLSCLPGLVVPRADLVLLPTIFFALAFLLGLRELRRERALAALISAGYCLLAAGGVWRSFVQAEDYHPMSVNAVIIANEFAYGPNSFVRVPEERRLRLLERLRSVNIRNYQEGRALTQAVSKDWRIYAANRPDKSSIFVPRFSFMAP